MALAEQRLPTGVRPPTLLHHRIGIAMEFSGMQVQELAKTMQVHRNTISNWLAARIVPSRTTLITLATLTGVDLDWLENGDRPDPDGGVRSRCLALLPLAA
jgi:transcriptional regulator with XRE-family HTH domain